MPALKKKNHVSDPDRIPFKPRLTGGMMKKEQCFRHFCFIPSQRRDFCLLASSHYQGGIVSWNRPRLPAQFTLRRGGKEPQPRNIKLSALIGGQTNRGVRTDQNTRAKGNEKESSVTLRAPSPRRRRPACRDGLLQWQPCHPSEVQVTISPKDSSWSPKTWLWNEGLCGQTGLPWWFKW